MLGFMLIPFNFYASVFKWKQRIENKVTNCLGRVIRKGVKISYEVSEALKNLKTEIFLISKLILNIPNTELLQLI